MVIFGPLPSRVGGPGRGRVVREEADVPAKSEGDVGTPDETVTGMDGDRREDSDSGMSVDGDGIDGGDGMDGVEADRMDSDAVHGDSMDDDKEGGGGVGVDEPAMPPRGC